MVKIYLKLLILVNQYLLIKNINKKLCKIWDVHFLIHLYSVQNYLKKVFPISK